MYERIFAALRDDIRSGKYGIGDRVPSEKELADEYNVSRITSKKALEWLSADGWIVRRPGRGSFVAGPAGQTASLAGDGRALSKSGAARGKLLIGLIINDFSEGFGTRLVHGLEETSRERDSYLIVRRSLGDPACEEEAIKGMLEIGVDGLVILPAHGEFFNAEILKLAIGKFPLVMIDRYLTGIPAGVVCTDNMAGAKRGVEHLFDLGHRHIGLLAPPPDHTTSVEDRIDGFVKAHAERGIPVDRELWMKDILSTMPSAFTAENRERDILKIKRLLQSRPRITALFAIEYNIALLAREAASRLGLAVPGDLSVICYDCPEMNGTYPFTHLRQQEEEMGRTAFEQVIDLLEDGGTPNRTLLEAQLVQGNSTALAPVHR
ncbi:GntR family transcriptional regulator [Cohnella sp. CBP 2801]|uniref:GntR family transcriptional regulator n=2 Tax=Cohnella zeiphila TaxID=2761120 RepID=A0A7X0SRJ2_9BACL|nr:GntR family transcriptional regulator [Cohnella zeiphila]